VVGSNASAQFSELPMRSADNEDNHDHDNITLRLILAVITVATLYVILAYLRYRYGT
jgi:hypothetical protein